jgi:hypothetical protein
MSERSHYRVRPWRGPTTGYVYYDVLRVGFFARKIITCFSEQEANEMIVKLGCWDQGKPTQAPAQRGGET